MTDHCTVNDAKDVCGAVKGTGDCSQILQVCAFAESEDFFACRTELVTWNDADLAKAGVRLTPRSVCGQSN